MYAISPVFSLSPFPLSLTFLISYFFTFLLNRVIVSFVPQFLVSRFSLLASRFSLLFLQSYSHSFHFHYIAGCFRNSHYLLNESIEVEGIQIHGARFKPFFAPPTGKQNAILNFLHIEVLLFIGRDSNAQTDWKHVPDEVDILVTHQPATGYGDICP